MRIPSISVRSRQFASGNAIACATAALISLWAPPALAREAVEASAPSALSVTLYRDPDRGEGEAMNRDLPRGFAMITETRQVTLPPGESTIRFTGVAEGMVAVSAILTGLPGGTIEKNRNADLLSPASLVDGSLGNRVRLTRTDPATGLETVEQAIVRTRADGGIVLQTNEGYEAVRCSGLPERLTFDRVPAGLSAQPVFSIDTRDASGGTYTVQLTYLAWGFDWQAHYVAELAEPGKGDAVKMRLMSWLTLLNDNGQSFENAELLVVAGRLNVVSDFEDLAEPTTARPLRLTCFPLGSTADGSPIPQPPLAPLPPPMAAPMMAQRAVALEAADSVIVTGMRAVEEALGDLKLYRVPERVTVSAKGLKQIAFIDREGVNGRLIYRADCSPDYGRVQSVPTEMLLTTVNDRKHGLGIAMPMGGITVFEPSAYGDQLVGEETLRDYAEGQDIEIEMGESPQVQQQCTVAEQEHEKKWSRVRSTLTNTNAAPVTVRLAVGWSRDWHVRGLRGTHLKDGLTVVEFTVPANDRREITWETRSIHVDD